MRHILLVLFAALTLGLTTTTRAADEPAGPALEIRLRAVNDLLTSFEYVGESLGKGDEIKQAAALVKAFAGPKGVEGVDIKRPFGFYGIVTPNVVDSPLVLMIPVADNDAFVNLLSGRLMLSPEKDDDGIYSLDVPNFNPKVYFTFANKYVYATVLNKKSIDPKTLIDPKTFFANDDGSVMSITIHNDRIPEAVRKPILGQIEQQLAAEKKKSKDNETPSERKSKDVVLDGVMSAMVSLFTDSKTAKLRMDVAPKTDDISIDFTLVPKDGSALKQSLVSAAKRTSIATIAGNVENPLMSGSVNLTVPESMRKPVDELIDLIVKESIEKAKEDEKPAVEKLMNAFVPTLKSGNIQLGAALTGTVGKLELLTALKVAEGKLIEKTAKELAKFVPADKGTFQFDIEKIGEANLHSGTSDDADAKRSFGTNTFWLTTADELLVMGIESKPKSTKRIATATAATSDILNLKIGFASLMPLAEKTIKPESIKEMLKEAFGDESPNGKDTLAVDVKGGETLNVKATLKGKALRFITLINDKKKES